MCHLESDAELRHEMKVYSVDLEIDKFSNSVLRELNFKVRMFSVGKNFQINRFFQNN